MCIGEWVNESPPPWGRPRRRLATFQARFCGLSTPVISLHCRIICMSCPVCNTAETATTSVLFVLCSLFFVCVFHPCYSPYLSFLILLSPRTIYQHYECTRVLIKEKVRSATPAQVVCLSMAEFAFHWQSLPSSGNRRIDNAVKKMNSQAIVCAPFV